MKRQEVRKEKYIIAALLTLAIFLLGLMLGLVIEGKRYTAIQTQSAQQKLDFESLQLQYAYMLQLDMEENCPAAIKSFESNIENLETSRIKLEQYNDNAKISKDDFTVLQREYTLAQINYWLFSQRTKDVCDVDQVSLIYFYSTKTECPDCEEQAFILTYLKKRFDEKLLVFALDANSEEPMVDILKTRYEISVYPTLVVEDKIFTGFTSKDEILADMCSHYSGEYEDCTALESS